MFDRIWERIEYGIVSSIERGLFDDILSIVRLIIYLVSFLHAFYS